MNTLSEQVRSVLLQTYNLNRWKVDSSPWYVARTINAISHGDVHQIIQAIMTWQTKKILKRLRGEQRWDFTSEQRRRLQHFLRTQRENLKRWISSTYSEV